MTRNETVGARRQRMFHTGKSFAAMLALASLATLPALAGTPAGRHLQPTELFNFAERQYPGLFPSHELNQTYAPYTYRLYPSSGNYLGVAGGQAYLLGPVSGGAVQSVGALDDFYCAVVHHECSTGPRSVRDRSDLLTPAAGGANSLFLYQTVINSIALDMLNMVANKTVSGTPTSPIAGIRSLPCVSDGSGSATVIDSDNSRTLTPGDSISMVASNCQLIETSGKPLFTGRIDITVASGSNTHNYWASLDETGGIELRSDLRDLSIQWGVLNGSYRYVSSWPTETSDFTVTTSFDDLAATTATAILQFADAKLFFTSDGQTLASAPGAITVNSAELGLGPLRHQLSVPVAMVVDQSSIRPRPTSGTLRLSGYGYYIDLGFIATAGRCRAARPRRPCLCALPGRPARRADAARAGAAALRLDGRCRHRFLRLRQPRRGAGAAPPAARGLVGAEPVRQPGRRGGGRSTLGFRGALPAVRAIAARSTA